MIGYVTLGVSSMDLSKKFYGELLAEMGAGLLFDMERIAFYGKSMEEPTVAICIPYDEQPNHPGNGNMLAFRPGSKEQVDALYKKAVELGASCDGEPGQRVPDVFYGAYVRDPDGNKICFAHFG